MKTCASCSYPFPADHCDNPTCFANPTLSPETKAALQAAHEKREAERIEREKFARIRNACFSPQPVCTCHLFRDHPYPPASAHAEDCAIHRK